ncbi:MAG TPA: class I SAM-dependent methyltransferase [Burkholderiales bacterium]|nr:class I SAM-dependent methyltransferase [Burkholderiales bacterium]
MPALARPALALFLAASASFVLAQATDKKVQAEPAFEPHSGQAGKDVVWVPTPQALVDRMLDMAKVTKRDFVVDLGSGDGRTVITAAKRGARAMGVEFNPDMVALSRENAGKAGVAKKAKFVRGDFFKTDFSKASVVTMFLLPDINLKLRPKLLKMRPGTRIVTNSFTMDDWEYDEKQVVTPEQGCQATWCTAYLWIVPAQVAGRYALPQGEFELKQSFQKLSGTLTSEGRTQAIEGKVCGREVTITTGGKTWRGRMNGRKLELS